MIRILHLIDTYRIGGPGKTIINSGLRIDRRQFSVHVGSFTAVDTRPNEFADAVRAAGLPYLALKESRRFNASHLGQIRRYVRAERIDVLHTHGYRTDLLGYLATRGLPVAIVTTHHGWIRNSRKQAAFAWMALRLAARFQGIELVSERLRDDLPTAVRCRPEVAVVRNGIVLDDYLPRGDRQAIRDDLNLRDDQLLIGVIGRLSIEKGSVEMLDAFARVVERIPSSVVAFVGEGPLRQSLQARAVELGVDDRVRFIPHQRDVRPYYEAVDMVVSPSRTEGLSNVILEALTVGRPVVATRVGGNTEIIAHEASALLVEARDPDAMAAAIVRIAEQPELAHRLIAAGRQRVEEEFSFNARMRREEEFYRQSLARRGGVHAA